MFDFLTDLSKRRSDPLRFAKHTLMMTSDAAAAHELFRYIATMAGKHVHDEFGQVLWVTGDETAMSTRVRLLSDWVGSHLHRYDVRPRMRCTAEDLEHNLSVFHISDSKEGIEDCTDLFVRAISIDPEINAARKTRVIFSDLSGWQFDELVRVKSLSENLSRRGVMTVIVDDDGALERSGVFSDTSYINKAVIDKSGKYSVEGASQGRLPHYRLPVQLLIPAHLYDEPSGDISRPAR
ncbi:hypothetical protein SAMN05428964_10521 [Thalassospira xiamenensis]|uniref:Uncharacterized protein n=2 Tax=Thalassospira xiamenensis TaxID=220697 RepID=A0A285TR03_9PROT|nr:hypothetical protein SAMN05428964_10521 [Thalassospira xiamenensis]